MKPGSRLAGASKLPRRARSLNRYLARRLLLDKIENAIQGQASDEAQRIAKIRRQKRKRSRRAKLRLLADKRHQGEKKSLRAPVRADRNSD